MTKKLISLVWDYLIPEVLQRLSTSNWFLLSLSQRLGILKHSLQPKVLMNRSNILWKRILFPDFCKTRTIPEMYVRLFDSPNSRYNLIIGRDVRMHGFILDHDWHVITWDGLTIPIQESTSTSSTVTTNFTCTDSALAVYAAASTSILKAKYEESLPQDVVQTCTHLSSQSQKKKLLELLTKCSRLFFRNTWTLCSQKNYYPIK